MPKKSGFTLVELIVVLVILGILAGVLVPTMIGWIRDARDQQVLLYANQAFKSAQSSLVESYGLDGDFKKGVVDKIYIKRSGIVQDIPCGYLTNFTMRKVQDYKKLHHKDAPVTSVYTDFNSKLDLQAKRITQVKVANDIHDYLGSEEKFNFTLGSNYTASLDTLAGTGNIDANTAIDINKITGGGSNKGEPTALVIAWNDKAEVIYFSFAQKGCAVIYAPLAGIKGLTLYHEGSLVRGLTSKDGKVDPIKGTTVEKNTDPKVISTIDLFDPNAPNIKSILDLKVFTDTPGLDSGAIGVEGSKVYNTLDKNGNAQIENLQENFELIGAKNWSSRNNGKILYWSTEDISRLSDGELIPVMRYNKERETFTVWKAKICTRDGYKYLEITNEEMKESKDADATSKKDYNSMKDIYNDLTK